jgi:hypothetical protein
MAELQRMRGPTGPDPRATVLAQMMQGQGQTDPIHPMSPYQGQRKSPDLPTRADTQYMQDNPTDMALEDYVNRFGFERMNRADPNSMRVRGPGLPSYGAPMPRPREPDMNPNNSMGPYDKISEGEGTEGGANLRMSDMERRRKEGMTTEQEMEMVQKGMVPHDWEANKPFSGEVGSDQMRLKKLIDDDPGNADEHIKQFVELHSQSELPDEYQDDYEEMKQYPNMER